MFLLFGLAFWGLALFLFCDMQQVDADYSALPTQYTMVWLLIGTFVLLGLAAFIAQAIDNRRRPRPTTPRSRTSRPIRATYAGQDNPQGPLKVTSVDTRTLQLSAERPRNTVDVRI
jgi:hypothetical protein